MSTKTKAIRSPRLSSRSRKVRERRLYEIEFGTGRTASLRELLIIIGARLTARHGSIREDVIVRERDREVVRYLKRRYGENRAGAEKWLRRNFLGDFK